MRSLDSLGMTLLRVLPSYIQIAELFGVIEGWAAGEAPLANPCFCAYSGSLRVLLIRAVGPWVSVAGREAILARGNPANRKYVGKHISDMEWISHSAI